MVDISANSVSPVLPPHLNNGSPALAKPEDIQETSTEFESMFLSMLVKELRESVEGGFFGDEKSDSLGAIFDMYMGRHLAESQPLGIGDAVSTYMKRSSG